MASTEDVPPILKGVLEAADTLPPFPNIVWKVIPLIRNMAPVSEIESIIVYDQAITARVLSMSRAPYYARMRTIKCLRDAIVALGEQQLIMVILMACSARYYTGDNKGYDLREGELWEHAISVALMTEIVGRRLGWRNLLTAYTAALLHDIGKTVLNIHTNSYFDSIFSLAREEVPFIEAERRVLGVDHQQLGSLIARRWEFPPEVVTAIGFHHNPMQANEYKDFAALVYICNRMVSAMGIGCGADEMLQPNEDEAFARLGISGHMVDQCLADLVEALDDTKQFLLPA